MQHQLYRPRMLMPVTHHIRRESEGIVADVSLNGAGVYKPKIDMIRVNSCFEGWPPLSPLQMCWICDW
jgi:hypothetical protein